MAWWAIKAIIRGAASDAWNWARGRKRCAYCYEYSEGEHSIHRDGFDEGPEVPLCNACGSRERPTCEEIWARIAK